MSRMEVTQQKYVLLDTVDFKRLNRWQWQYNSKTGYVTRTQWVKDKEGKFTKHRTIYLHKEIHPAPKGFYTDHKNGNKLDNRRSNLRTVTRAQNNQNARKRKDNTTGCKGVCWREKSRDFVVYINVNKKRIHLKTYRKLEDAIIARREAELKYHGEYAYQGGY